MKRFLMEQFSLWGGMACLSFYLYTGSVWYAAGFAVLFAVNTFLALYKHAQFVVFTQSARERFEREAEEEFRKTE